ncbi:MAG: hypothetical protein ABEH86_10655 [Haloarcula sp.]
MNDVLPTLARSGQTDGNTDLVELADAARDACEYADVGGCESESSIPVGSNLEGDQNRLRYVFENRCLNAADPR